MKNLDTDKSGMVKHQVFFELLSLHNIDLTSDAKSHLKKNYSKNQTINYKEAINQITIDLQAAGGTENTQGTMKWTVFALAKRPQVGDDSVSQAGSSHRMLPAKSQSGLSHLSKEKLANFDKISAPRDALSKVPSKVGSIAPSMAPTKQSVVSKLEKIEEAEVEGTPVHKTKFEDIKTQHVGEISKFIPLLF